MAKCGRTNLSGGGGVGSDELTVTANKILKNYTYVGADTDDEIGTGTIESMAGQTVTPDASDHVIECKDKYMTGNITIPKVAGLAAGNVAVGTTIGGVAGTYNGLGNAVAANVLSGKTFSTAALSNASGTMTNYSDKTSTSAYAGGTFRSGTTGYVFASPSGTGYYSSGTYLRIPATNLAAGNIKKGVSILGITGTLKTYLTSPTSILSGETWGAGIATGFSSNENITITHSTSNYVFNGINASFYIRTNAAVNMTDYKYLKAVVSETSYTYSDNKIWGQTNLMVSSNPNYSNYICTSAASSPSTSNSTVICDVSSINGMYYIYFKIKHGNIYQSTSVYSITLSNN